MAHQQKRTSRQVFLPGFFAFFHRVAAFSLWKGWVLEYAGAELLFCFLSCAGII